MSEFLARGQAILASQPFSQLVGAELTGLSLEHAEITLPITEKLKQQHGFVHGGVVSYLADNALTFAGGFALGGGVVTSEMKINYVRPGLGDTLIARAHVISLGKSQAVTRCDIFAVTDGVEKLCAAAQGTIVKMEKKD